MHSSKAHPGAVLKPRQRRCPSPFPRCFYRSATTCQSASQTAPWLSPAAYSAVLRDRESSRRGAKQERSDDRATPPGFHRDPAEVPRASEHHSPEPERNASPPSSPQVQRLRRLLCSSTRSSSSRAKK